MSKNLLNKIELINLPSYYYFNFNNEFKDFIFKKGLKLAGSWDLLSGKMNYSSTRLRIIKHGECLHNCGKRNPKERVLISKPLLIRLLNFTSIPLKVAEQNVIEMRDSHCSNPIFIKLPIFYTKYLAQILGHSFGDGCAHLSYFVYANNEQVLINKFMDGINKIFGFKIPFKLRKDNNCKIIVYNSIISKILNLVGGVLGNKVNKEFDVPYWIKNGDNKIKSSFIRALFDDESHVNKKNKLITISFVKNKKYECSLKMFLISIKDILNDFSIKINGPCHTKDYEYENKLKTLWTIRISGYNNLLLYNQKIGFLHPKKRNDLNYILISYKRRHYQWGEIKKLILSLLLKSPKTTGQIAKILNRHIETIRIHLNNLYKNGKINKLKGMKNNNKIETLWILKMKNGHIQNT